MFATVGMLMFSTSLANAPPAFASDSERPTMLVWKYLSGPADQKLKVTDKKDKDGFTLQIVTPQGNPIDPLNVGETFKVAAAFDSKHFPRLGTDTLFIFKESYDFQGLIKWHTSCSQELFAGDTMNILGKDNKIRTLMIIGTDFGTGFMGGNTIEGADLCVPLPPEVPPGMKAGT